LSNTSRFFITIGTGNVIADDALCRNAAFVFDDTVTNGELLELRNGEWFLITQEDGLDAAIKLEGKWDRR
jgi:hypothetical protein